MAVLCASCASSEARLAHSTASTVASARAFTKSYIAALEARDEAVIRTLFVEDSRFAWFTDGQKRYTNVDGVLAGLRAYASRSFKTTLEDAEVLVLTPRYVTARTKFTTELRLPNGDPHRFGGVITWILTRPNATGAWRVLSGHTSTPGGPPASK